VALGMWDDVIAANEASLATVAKTVSASVAPTIGCGHAGLWLHYAYLQEGRLADARRLSSACHEHSAKSAGAASGYAEMRLQYVVDVERPEPGLTPIADVSKLPGFIDLTQSYATAFENLRRGDTTGITALVARMHRVTAGMMKGEMAITMPE